LLAAISITSYASALAALRTTAAQIETWPPGFGHPRQPDIIALSTAVMTSTDRGDRARLAFKGNTRTVSSWRDDTACCRR
jgi:hypothetical protein